MIWHRPIYHPKDRKSWYSPHNVCTRVFPTYSIIVLLFPAHINLTICSQQLFLNNDTTVTNAASLDTTRSSAEPKSEKYTSYILFVLFHTCLPHIVMNAYSRSFLGCLLLTIFHPTSLHSPASWMRVIPILSCVLGPNWYVHTHKWVHYHDHNVPEIHKRYAEFPATGLYICREQT